MDWEVENGVPIRAVQTEVLAYGYLPMLAGPNVCSIANVHYRRPWSYSSPSDLHSQPNNPAIPSSHASPCSQAPAALFPPSSHFQRPPCH
jgi:hypothetical protein